MSELTDTDLEEITIRTIAHYQGRAEQFWEGTRDHDVSQNIDSLLDVLAGQGPHRILDFGCGPGRDILEFQRRGHQAVGLDGCAAFVEKARSQTGAEVLHQNFLDLQLLPESFDGIFANASLFHVPNQQLPGVLARLRSCLTPGGVLFASNPRGQDSEGWNGERYGAYHEDKRWLSLLETAHFEPVSHYYRPAGLPRHEQTWLASLWRKP